MAESFGAATFHDMGNGSWQYSTYGTHQDAEKRYFPGSDNWVIHDMGARKDALVLQIRCTGAQLAALESARGQIRTLTYSRGTTSAYLLAVRNPREILNKDEYYAELEFWPS